MPPSPPFSSGTIFSRLGQRRRGRRIWFFVPKGYIDYMGWVWRDDEGDADSAASGDISRYGGAPDRCSTRKIVKSHCRTEEVEPRKFIRKCEKTEEILRDCIGKPVEVVQSNKEYTEDDVTEQVLKGSSSLGSSDHAIFDFPGLQNDIDAIGRSFLGNIDRFFQAAEEMKKGFFGVFDDSPYANRERSPSSWRRGIPIEDPRPKEYNPSPGEQESSLDFSGIAKDV
ncbi:hypothetical protein MLD38_033137 [Melastoma candidum]|uniref:Uncharacterized protein n=1 Tax=Melastoma candidum TaxID=119954 RepID=A0ACB9M5S7_9MYRT|nr:hypothetical protein MLD38_033137 [Melastoma candidum]